MDKQIKEIVDHVDWIVGMFERNQEKSLQAGSHMDFMKEINATEVRVAKLILESIKMLSGES
ncbi:hypothetical protein N9924_01030 [bacterium]|nr:hypothetical protein [bacterium]